MDEVKEAADNAQKLAEEEAKKKEQQKDAISKKNAKIEKLENYIITVGPWHPKYIINFYSL